MKSVVYIIFNPNSTGDGQKNATELEQRLKKHSITTHVLPTKRAGHAYQLAKTHAGKNHIIISSSGDGGFHEVVGGVLNSSHPETVVGVLPSGNANDHYHARHRGSLITRIKTRDTDTQDVICIRHGSKTYFGHSYAGLGLSADTGKTLTEHDLNRLTESWLVIKHLFSRTPVKLRMNGQTRRYDSFVISVVEKMAKHLKLSDDTERPDGQFAIHAQPHRSLLSLLSYLIRLSLNRQDESRFSSSLTMELLHKATLQVDGETYELPAGSKLSIECQRNKLQTII